VTLRKLLLICPVVLLAACDDKPEQTINTPLPDKTPVHYDIPPEQASAFAAQIGLTAYTSMSMATQAAQDLDSRLQSFLYHPNPLSLEEVQRAWRSAYSDFLETLIFAELPISDPSDWHKQGIDYQHTLVLLDSWPIEGGYIDHVPGYPFSGIVNDLTLELTEESLLSQHGFSDPSYAALGYHPLEFMLWGANGKRSPQDFFPQENTAPVVTPTEGGIPAATDNGSPVITDSGDNEAADIKPQVQNNNRRRQYVQLVSDQLQKHLHRLQRRWEPSNGYYAGLVQRSRPLQVLTAAMNASQRLLSDELLDRRLAGNSSEFSHSSEEDIRAIVHGLRAVWLPVTEAETAADSTGESGTTLGGIALVLPQENSDHIIADWQEKFDLINSALDEWKSRNGSEETRQKVREHLIGLMSVLQRSAGALDIPLRTEH